MPRPFLPWLGASGPAQEQADDQSRGRESRGSDAKLESGCRRKSDMKGQFKPGAKPQRQNENWILLCENEQHGAGNEEIRNEDNHRSSHHGLGSSAPHALRTAAHVEAIVTAHAAENESKNY